MTPLKILFMGSPEMALPTLQALVNAASSSPDQQDQIVGIISQPDRPAGRGRELTPPAVAVFAKEKGIPLFQPEKVKNNPEFLETLRNLAPDLIVVVAYGKILPTEILKLPARGCVNVHFSLLPQYRGAAPVQWALINSEEETGVTTFLIVEKLDAGPILLQKKILIHEEDDAQILGHRLAIAGAHLLMETIEGLKSEEIIPAPQNERLVSLAPPLKKEDGLIDWSRKSKLIVGQIRGMNPWPGAFTSFKGKRLKIHKAEVTAPRKHLAPGEVIEINPDGIEVACGSTGQSALTISELQLEGGKKMLFTDFLKGHEIIAGEKLGESVP